MHKSFSPYQTGVFTFDKATNLGGEKKLLQLAFTTGR